MLTFGNIRERFEKIVGESIDAGVLGTWIDEAQIEIAKLFGKRVSQVIPIPLTTLSVGINSEVEVIPVTDITTIPAYPDYVAIGDWNNYEIVYYENMAGANLTEVTRGMNGTLPDSWTAGTNVRLNPISGVEHELPDDLLSLHEVRDTDDAPYFGWQVTADYKLHFFNDGMYRIIYTKVPDPIDFMENGSTPEVHAVFHNDLITYCLSKHWEEIAEGIPDEENKSLALMAQFNRRIRESARLLNRNPNQQYTIGINLWG